MKTAIRLKKLNSPIRNQRDIIDQLDEIAGAYPEIIKTAREIYLLRLNNESNLKLKVCGFREINAIVCDIQNLLHQKEKNEQMFGADNDLA